MEPFIRSPDDTATPAASPVSDQDQRDEKSASVASVGLEGPLSCPRCHSKVGTFSWIGIRCSCGSWIVPGFALLKSKVDCITTGCQLALPLPNNQPA
jgi:hypothetical protein